MIQHHPDSTLLAEYAAGSMSQGQSLGIAVHLHYCDLCRQQVRALNQLGGAMLETHTPGSDLEANALQKLFARIDRQAGEHQDIEYKGSEYKSSDGQANSSSEAAEIARATAARTAPKRLQKELPPLVAKLVGNPVQLRWQRLSPAMKMANLQTGQNQCQVSLIKIAAGGRVLEHDHRGNEFTVVLKGAFSDHEGVYQAGDFLHNQPGEVHTPSATADTDCLCFTVLDAPLKFTGLLGRVINPFVRLTPQ